MSAPALFSPNVAVLATTATANDRVVLDVLAQLGQGTLLERGPLTRPSLALQNILLPILAALEEAEEGLSLPALTHKVNLRKGQIEKVLKLLAAVDGAPIVRDGSRWVRTPNAFHPDRARIQRLTEHRQAEWQQMQEYLATSSCLMAFLGRALDDPHVQPCGRCANCLGRPLMSTTVKPSTVRAAPFAYAVSKVSETQRQRSMMNTWQQAHNLDGAFAVQSDVVPPGAVLLVDDIVDSGWSMTIVGTLLREAGAGLVYPLALSLASASSG